MMNIKVQNGEQVEEANYTCKVCNTTVPWAALWLHERTHEAVEPIKPKAQPRKNVGKYTRALKFCNTCGVSVVRLDEHVLSNRHVNAMSFENRSFCEVCEVHVQSMYRHEKSNAHKSKLLNKDEGLTSGLHSYCVECDTYVIHYGVHIRTTKHLNNMRTKNMSDKQNVSTYAYKCELCDISVTRMSRHIESQTHQRNINFIVDLNDGDQGS